MFRPRLLSVVLAVTLASSGGCCVFDHPLFSGPGLFGRRDNACCPSPCEGCGGCSGSSPVEGPVLVDPGTLPPNGNGNGHARITPAPQSSPMPYTP